MSMIPDCRALYEKDTANPWKEDTPKDNKDNEINPYFYGLLDEEDSEFLRGFDWNTTNALNNFFDNTDVAYDILEKIGINPDDIDENIVDGAIGEDLQNYTFKEQDERPVKWFSEYTDDELKNMNQATKFMLAMKEILNEYIENERDMLVTSMIDDMDDEEHKERIAKISETLK